MAEFVFRKELDELIRMQREQENIINQRVAEIVAKMDPWELIMKEYHGVFSEEYQHPEYQLNEQGKFLMEAFGYQVNNDPSLKYLIEWIMNVQGNSTIKAPKMTRDSAFDVLLYGRAQIATMLLLKKEVGRLASNYQARVDKQKGEAFINTNTVE